ncbi:putative ribonuclease H-like domain-containing protein [Tanacetum coccineum]|uniref:Ribonuclease H-like domain-containing protein n=1 Tax=Tanacetum coccineum TaxID=301880 RepID=A0ABQ5E1H6_9ASTR
MRKTMLKQQFTEFSVTEEEGLHKGYDIFQKILSQLNQWKESSKNLKKLINSSMSTRTKIGLGFKEYFGKDEVFDLSTPSVFYPEPVEEDKPLYSWFSRLEEHACSSSPSLELICPPHDNDKSSDSETYASCDSSLKTKTKDFPPTVDIKTLPESDVEDPNSTAGSPSFSCLENVKSPRIFCNKSGMNNRNVCKNNSVRVKKCFVCGSKLHLIKDCDFYNCVDSVPCKSKAASVPAGSRNSPASVTAGGSDPAASRNNHSHFGQIRPTSSCWSKRPQLFLLETVILLGDPSTDNDIGIVDSGCSRSMTETRKSLMICVRSREALSNLEVEMGIFTIIPILKNTLSNAIWEVPQIGHLKLLGDQVTILNNNYQLGKFEAKLMNVILLGTQETNIPAGTQAQDSDSDVEEQVIVVPSFPSTSFAESEDKDAAARYGYLFSQATAEILSQAEAEIRNQGVSADRDPAGIDSAGGVSAGKTSAGSVPTAGNPAGTFQPAGSYDPAALGDPAASTSVSADFIPVHADESTLPPGKFLGSSENTKRFPVPSDVCKDQFSSGIFTSSSYDDDFRATLTNLAPAVEVNPVPTKRVNTIHPQSQILGDLASPVSDQEASSQIQLQPTCIAKALEYPDGYTMQERCNMWFITSNIWLSGISADVKKCPFSMEKLKKNLYVTQPKALKILYLPKACIQSVKALRGTIDKTLFIKKDTRDILLVQVYVDDIIFGSTNKAWCDEFEVLMKGEFEMSAMGEMTFFLGLQVKQLPDGIFISQDKYVKDMLTKFDMESVRTATTPYEAAKTKLKDETDPPVNVHLYRSMIGSLMYLTASRPDIMFAVSACSRHQVTPLTSHLNAVKKIFKYLKGQPKLGLWYPKDSPFQLEAYSDSDYAGSHGDRKSTTGGCQFLGRRLISWQCKKQTIVATSSTEAEYVAAASCCAQVLWIQNQLLDYGFNFMNTKIFIDNQSTICIVKNPVFHQRTKHIEIRHHFIRDANEKNLIQVLKIHTDDNVADLLTKAFDGPRFAYLVVHIGMVDMLVSAGCTMVLLVVILPAGRMVSAGCTMVLLVVIFPAGCLVSAVILPAGRMVSAGCTMVLLVAILPAGCFVSAAVYAANTSIYAAELVCAGSIKFLLPDLFLLVVSNHAGGTMYLLPE